MKWTIVIVALIVSLVFACTPTQKVDEGNGSTKKIDEGNETTQKLTGSWTMYKEICCGRRNMERTGAEMQKPKQLVFASNKITVTDLKTKESKTTIYKIETTKEGDYAEVMYINFDGKKGILRFENDDLIIDYGYMDLQKEFYIKSK